MENCLKSKKSKSSAKTAGKTFTLRSAPNTLRLGDDILWSRKIKYIGITLDRKLTWSLHIFIIFQQGY